MGGPCCRRVVRDWFRRVPEAERRPARPVAHRRLRGRRPGQLGLLMMALRDLEVGPAYAVWTGIGAAGAAGFGMIFLGDTVSTMKLVSIALILAGVVGLNLYGVTP